MSKATKTVNELTNGMDQTHIDAFNLGMEKAFRLHFEALRQIDKKVYCLPKDAKALEMEVLEHITRELDGQTQPEALMYVNKSTFAKASVDEGKEATNG